GGERSEGTRHHTAPTAHGGEQVYTTETTRNCARAGTGKSHTRTGERHRGGKSQSCHLWSHLSVSPVRISMNIYLSFKKIANSYFVTICVIFSNMRSNMIKHLITAAFTTGSGLDEDRCCVVPLGV
ncbi:hypothetical protein NP493_730g00026, partial [Ridgeia piscesae]